jgi:hypothetical protein
MKKLTGLLGAGVVVASVVIASGSAWAQGAPDPRAGPSTPVQVVNTATDPVPVTGTVNGDVQVTGGRLDVTALNDVVNTPYMVSVSGSFVGGDLTPFNFDVPDGMRLIVETITVRYALEAAGNAVTQMGVSTPQGSFWSGEIPLQQQGGIDDIFGTKYWIVGTLSAKLRIDAALGKDNELAVFSRLSTGAIGTANVLVAGYLVAIP